MKNYKTLGERTEAIILAEFIKRDIPVLLPFGDNQRYDMVIDILGKLYRVQCKTGKFVGGAVVFSVQSIRRNSTGWKCTTYVGQIDLFATYCEKTNAIYVVPIDDVKNYTEKVHLRVDAPKNNQKNSIRMADEYCIDVWLKNTLKGII